MVHVKSALLWVFVTSTVAFGDDLSDMKAKIDQAQDELQSQGQPLDMEAMMQQMQGQMAPKKEYYAVPSDVKFILCDTCKALVQDGYDRMTTLRKKLTRTKLGENQIDENMEYSCEHGHPQAAWIEYLDMVEAGDRINLVKHETSGKCQDECKTIGLACKKVYSDVGTDIVEQLYHNKKTVEELQEFICGKLIKRMKGSCNKKYPKIPETRQPGGDNFEAKSELDIQLAGINSDLKIQNLKDEL